MSSPHNHDGSIAPGGDSGALRGAEAVGLLRRCAFFATTPDAALADLAALAEPVELAAGQTIFAKGDIGTAMYFVLEGTVRLHHGDVVIGRLDAGEAFGEVAALSKEVRTASVTAESATRLLKLEQQAIYSVVAARPDAARSVIEALCFRERQIIDEKFERIVAGRVLERELEIGQRIQQHFLPDTMPEIDGWSMHGLLRPARKVAGDFYDFFAVPGLDRIGVVIGDVCDKGVGAALFMTLFRSLLRSGVLRGRVVGSTAAGDDPGAVLSHALSSTNDYVASTHADSSMFASVFYGLLDPATGELHYINAGHEPPVIVAAGAVRGQLAPTGPVIGLFEGVEHRVEAVRLSPGETLFGYTDGATDARNRTGQQYSEERLLADLCDAVAVSANPLGQLLTSVEAFTDGAEQYDDVTMICVRRH